jgi:C_GCAxxG_C_C family probable redox protein
MQKALNFIAAHSWNKAQTATKSFEVIYMLYDLLKTGFGNKEDYNCAEKVLYGANRAYNLGLDARALKLSSGFGGGMGIEDACGALTASVMILGSLFVKDHAHESSRIKDLSSEFLKRYNDVMGSIDCAPLKKKYRTDEIKCRDVILKAAYILDEIVIRERGKN